MNKDAKLFARLRLRLTVVCTVMTGVILIAMAMAALLVSQSQLNAKSGAAFRSEVNAILYHLRSQTVVEHTWLSQTESGGDLILSLELSGQPLLYGNSPERQKLVGETRDLALQEYGFDLSVPPSSRYQPEELAFIREKPGGEAWRVAAVRLPQEKGWIGLLVLRSMAEEREELLIQRLAFGGFVAVALVLLALFAWVFLRRAMAPVEESRRRQTEFVAAASHELRAPLAVVRATLSALRNADAEKAEHFTAMAEGECDRMSGLISDMLSLANADSGNWGISTAPVEPETLLLETAERFEHIACEKGIHLTTTLPENPLPKCDWDGGRVQQLLSILTDNAVSYTPGGGVVRLNVEQVEERVRFTVTDTGPGIPDGEKERVFERFYRADAARTRRSHYGLGLCIAREIVRLHGGTVAVEDNPGGGAVFVVRFPIK